MTKDAEVFSPAFDLYFHYAMPQKHGQLSHGSLPCILLFAHVLFSSLLHHAPLTLMARLYVRDLGVDRFAHNLHFLSLHSAMCCNSSCAHWKNAQISRTYLVRISSPVTNVGSSSTLLLSGNAHQNARAVPVNSTSEG